MEQSIKSINDFILEFDINVPKIKKSDDFLELYSRITDALDQIDEVLSQNQDESDKYQLRRKAIIQWSQLIQQINLDEALDQYVEKLQPSSKLVHQIREEFHKSPQIITLYVLVFQKCLDYAKDHKEFLHELLGILEEDKDFVLHANIKKLKNSDIPSHSYNLVPCTPRMQLSKLIEYIYPNAKIDHDIDSLGKYVKSVKECIILQEYITSSPFEYDLFPLLDYKKPEILEGVNEQLISKTETVLHRGQQEKPKSAKKSAKKLKSYFRQVVLGDQDASQIIVVRTTDLENYRCYAPWLNNQTRIPRYRIQKLLDSVQNVAWPSRAVAYQQAVQAGLFRENKIFRKKQIDMEVHLGKVIDIGIHVAKQEIFMKIKTLGMKLLDKKQKPYDIIHDERLVEIFIEGLDKHFVGEFEKVVLHPPNREEISTYAMEALYASRRFTKELHDGIVREPIRNRTEFEYLMETIERALDLSLQVGSNPYTAAYLLRMIHTT